MSARESFLSFARSATGPHVKHQGLSAINKQERLYQLMRAEPPQVWHLLSWCVVALEEHLSEVHQPQSAPTDEERGETLAVSAELFDALFDTGANDRAVLEIYGMSSFRELLAARIIKKLDEYRAGKRGEG